MVRNPDPLEWLLEESNPSVRYYTLRDILGRNDDDADLRAAKRKIPGSKIVARILSKQKPGGYWEDADSPYLPKYKASYWQIMVLADLGMKRIDPRTSSAGNYIFRFQHAAGGFSCNTQRTALREYAWRARRHERLLSKAEWTKKHVYEGQLSCLTGNIVAALIRLGYENDPRVRRALNWLVTIQNTDGGWLCPYWSAHARDKHGCFYGTIGPLEAFSELLPGKRTRAIQRAIDRGAEFMLVHHLFKADHHDFRIINKSWLKQSFPLFYSYSTLRGLDVLSRLGYVRDVRTDRALALLSKKRTRAGVWILERSPGGRMQASIETVGRPSKWITLIALRVLKRFGVV